MFPFYIPPENTRKQTFSGVFRGVIKWGNIGQKCVNNIGKIKTKQLPSWNKSLMEHEI